MKKEHPLRFWFMKTVLGFAALLLLVSAATAEADEETIGWKITESSEITQEAIDAFAGAVQELTDAVYEPVALLGEQQGINRQQLASLRANGNIYGIPREEFELLAD